MAEPEAVLFRDEDGQEVEFYVLDFIEVSGQEYVIVATPDEGQDAYILRVEVEEDGTEVYATIDADEEWERVSDAYEELIQQEDEWVDVEGAPDPGSDEGGSIPRLE